MRHELQKTETEWEDLDVQSARVCWESSKGYTERPFDVEFTVDGNGVAQYKNPLEILDDWDEEWAEAFQFAERTVEKLNGVESVEDLPTAIDWMLLDVASEYDDFDYHDN